MSLYKKYLEESLKEYRYRIKTVFPLETNEQNKIESVLRKYDLKDVSAPRRTPLQEHPLEFNNISNREVFIVDAVLGMPASAQQLHSELYDALDVPGGELVVRSDSDPIELQTEQLNNEEEYETKLSTDPNYQGKEQVEGEAPYGDEYNQKFLSRIARAKAKVDSDVSSENAEFNKDMPGVKPAYDEKDAGDHSVVTHRGNFTHKVEQK